MSDRDAFEHIIASLNESMLDDARWPATSVLLDEACGVAGNALGVGEGPVDDIRLSFVGIHLRGQRREDIEREYITTYFATDERIPRLLQRPYGRLLPMKGGQYTVDELKTSRAYNELMVRAQYEDGVAVTMQGLDGSAISWSICKPVASGGWGASRISMIERLCPHIRQFVLVRQALARAAGQSTTVTALLDNARVGVVHLDRRGRILEANDRARSVLLGGDGLADRDGRLGAYVPNDERRLESLVAAALPTPGAVAASGSMLLCRPSVAPPFAVHVRPVTIPETDYGSRHVAALVLIVEAGSQHRVDPDVVAMTLGLTPSESRVAVWLAEGKSAREMAESTGHTKGAIYWHLKQIYQKLHISRQADLVRLVLSIAEFG